MTNNYTPPKVWKWEGQKQGRFTSINRPIVTGFQDSVTDLNDVWQPSHLPYGANGGRLSSDRRIAAKRHSNKGSNMLFLDGHAGFRDSRLIDINLFREKKL